MDSKGGRVNVKARARLFEQAAAVDPPDSVSTSRRGSGSAETKKKHAEAALKARTVQQVLKLVSERLKESDDGVVDGERKLKGSSVDEETEEEVSEANNIGQNACQEQQKEEEVGGGGGGETGKTSDVTQIPEKVENSEPLLLSQPEVVEQKNRGSVVVQEMEKNEREKSAEKIEEIIKIEANGKAVEKKPVGAKLRKGKRRPSVDAGSGFKSCESVSTCGEPGEGGCQSTTQEASKIRNGANSGSQMSQDLPIPIPTNGITAAAAAASASTTAAAVPFSPSASTDTDHSADGDGKAGKKYKDSRSASLKLEKEGKCVLPEPSKQPELGGGKEELLLEDEDEECKDKCAIDAGANRSSPNDVSLSTVIVYDDSVIAKVGDVGSTFREESPTTTTCQNKKNRSTFWQLLSDSGSSENSSASDPEFTGLAKLNPAVARWQSRSRSEPSALLSKLKLGTSRSSTSSPEPCGGGGTETDWLYRQCIKPLGLNIEELEGTKCNPAVHAWSDTDNASRPTSFSAKDERAAKFAARLPAGGGQSIFSSSSSSGADKWRFKSEGPASDDGSTDYDLQLKEETPSLLELLSSVQKIQEEFGQPTFDIPEVLPAAAAAPLTPTATTTPTTKRKRPDAVAPRNPADWQIYREDVPVDRRKNGGQIGYCEDPSQCPVHCISQIQDELQRSVYLLGGQPIPVDGSAQERRQFGVKSVQFQSGTKEPGGYQKNRWRGEEKKQVVVGHNHGLTNETAMEPRVKLYGDKRVSNNTPHTSRKYESPVANPSTPKVHQTNKSDLQAYLTLGRRGSYPVRTETNACDTGPFSDSEQQVDFANIENILSELDFAKYQRGRSNTLKPQKTRSLSESPHPGSRIPFGKRVEQTPSQQQVPLHTYRQYSLPNDRNAQVVANSQSANRSKFKELTEKLKLAAGNKPTESNEESASDVASSRILAAASQQQQQILLAQQLQNHKLQQELIHQHKQLQKLQQEHLSQLQRLQQQHVTGLGTRQPAVTCQQESGSAVDVANVRRKQNPLVKSVAPQSKDDYCFSGVLNYPRYMDPDKCPKLTDPRPDETYENHNASNASLDSAVDSVPDEGLCVDSVAAPSFVQTYRNVTSAPVMANMGRRLSESDRGMDSSPYRSKDDPMVPNSPDKRKRRKNLNNNVGIAFQVSPYESNGKTGNGRSLTYPPQRKGSLCEEMDFTSVDSNGMKSFGGAMLMDNLSAEDEPRRQLSDVSLADSHYTPSEPNASETYLDVMESVIQGPNDRTEERSGKLLKKKHYSDPSGEKNNDGLLDLPEFIAAAKSDPQLGKKGGKTHHRIQSPTNVDEDVHRSPPLSDPQSPKSGLRVSHSAPVTLVSSDAEDRLKSPQQQRRYFKKRLRGPYGEMLEEEMRKSGEKQLQTKLSMAEELGFLQEIIEVKPSGSAVTTAPIHGSVYCDDPWNLQEGVDSDNGKDGKDELQDTRTHVVGELYDTERSYVESLHILVHKYYLPLKSSENAGLVDSSLVEDMFFQIPEILCHHEAFLEILRRRLENWDNKQKVGDVFVEAFTKQQVIHTYTAFINNWKTAKEAIKIATQAKPAFAKFLEHMSREHKGKLALDALLIMPVQRIPRYELLIKELLKHTQVDHPDHRLLVLAQKEVHDLAVKINRMEREAYEAEQMLQKLKEVENLIDGLVDLVQPDRLFLRYDLVTMSGGLGTKKERCLFLFSDLLIITSIKRKSGTAMRKASAALNSPVAFPCSLEMNKYKMLMKLSLEDLDTSRNNDMNVKKTLKEIEHLEEDIGLLSQITDLANGLNCVHQSLDDIVRDLLTSVGKQLQENHSAESRLMYLELTVTTQEGIENLTLVFSSPEKRSCWETAFIEAKQKIALLNGQRPPPEFISPLAIRKTRAGLQFTCATPTLGLNAHNLRDVWVCNSDGYVGQVCVLSLQPDPTVTSCNGVSNARILCVASVPAATATEGQRRRSGDDGVSGVSVSTEEVETEKSQSNNIQLDSESSEEEDEGIESQADDDIRKRLGDSVPSDDSIEVDQQQPTMWLGTEDGCIHIYNCNDNIRTRKNKVKLQHPAPIHCIVHTDNKVFVSLANGDLTVYRRNPDGGWHTNNPQRLSVGSAVAPVSRMIIVAGKLWCACQNMIKVINTSSLEVEQSFVVNADVSRSVLCMTTSGFGVWISIQNSANIKLYHATSYECLLDLSVAPTVAKMLAGCDDIIRQHKAACLRITALLTCKELLWVGTSAGVIINVLLPHLTSTTTKLTTVPNVSGIPHGHTGHVRFLTYVETQPCSDNLGRCRLSHRSIKGRDGIAFSRRSSLSATMANKMLVISGGDGYEDFRNTDVGETAGRDDSTNHLLLWQV